MVRVAKKCPTEMNMLCHWKTMASGQNYIPAFKDSILPHGHGIRVVIPLMQTKGSV